MVRLASHWKGLGKPPRRHPKQHPACLGFNGGAEGRLDERRMQIAMTPTPLRCLSYERGGGSCCSGVSQLESSSIYNIQFCLWVEGKRYLFFSGLRNFVRWLKACFCLLSGQLRPVRCNCPGTLYEVPPRETSYICPAWEILLAVQLTAGDRAGRGSDRCRRTSWLRHVGQAASVS